MKRSWSLFAYPVMDIKAAEAALNRRATVGWRLEKVWLGLLASFVPARRPVQYCVDWCDPNREDLNYRALCEEAGWTWRQQTAYRNIYEAPEGTAPIQTDSGLEYLRFRKKVLRRMVLGVVPLACCLVFVLLLSALARSQTGGPGWWEWENVATALCRSDLTAILLLTLPLPALGGMLWLGRMLLRLIQWRSAAREGRPFPTPGRRSAALASGFCLLGWLYAAVLLWGIGLDLIGGRLNLGLLLGFALGSILVLLRCQGAEYQRRRRGAAVLLIVSLAGLGAGVLLPDQLTDSFHVKGPVEQIQMLPESMQTYGPETEASLVAAHTRWWEVTREGEDRGWDDGRLWGDMWTTRGPRLANWITEHCRAELGTGCQTPLAGHEGVWLARADLGGDPEAGPKADLWVIRRGNTVLRVQTDGLEGLDETWLEDTLAMLEGDGTHG